MNFYINQSIIIHQLRVDGVSNSSVLQIGSAGSINALSNLYNTGAYTEPAPEAQQPTGFPGTGQLVPLQGP
ncbi:MULTISPECIES: spore germination protein GerPB [Bacillaceae]|uniref:spore germination protein GerPB n=1 Tax=Bacillaceae TaxID=186817 RepID=UPI001BDE3135|nr:MULTISPECIES: spore germination protein GerPB [Bacillaceae]MDX8361334.1 spore germination protein GerPB [Cytobacillus sp. IB215316]MDX8364530.1 spore germination protein GerPB [Cytobacillus sp. IB215665]